MVNLKILDFFDGKCIFLSRKFGHHQSMILMGIYRVSNLVTKCEKLG